MHKVNAKMLKNLNLSLTVYQLILTNFKILFRHSQQLQYFYYNRRIILCSLFALQQIFVKLLMSSPSQLFSCVDANAILKSPVNNSTAKNHWSFSKDSRFKAPKFYCESFYNIPETKSDRKAGFGYGKKTDLEHDKNQQHVVPPPTTYNISSFVDTNMHHKKGFTPRFSRQQIAPMSYIDVEARKTPGPGRYEEFRYNQSPRWSLRPRVNSQLFAKTTQKIVPGPGAHENKEVIDPVGKYYLSNHKNSKSKIFNPSRSERFYKSTNQIPPPGTYNPKNDLPADGDYVLSNNKSARKRAFLMGRRSSFVDDLPRRVQTPGPGSYRLPSDFGQYDEKVQQKRRLSITKGTERTERTRAEK